MSESLPRPTEADGAALFEAAQTGRAEMCTVDEAAIRAIGFTPQPRGEGIAEFPQARASMDDPVVRAAAERLLADGLGTPATDPARAAVTPSGPLLAWFFGVLLAKQRSFNVSEVLDPDSERLARRRRVTLTGAVDGTPMAMVEYTDVPVGAGDEPLPVRIEAIRLGDLVYDLSEAAFAPVAAGATRTMDILSMTPHGPARLGVDADHAVLLTHNRGLRRRTRTETVDRTGFEAYLWEMLGQLASAT